MTDEVGYIVFDEIGMASLVAFLIRCNPIRILPPPPPRLCRACSPSSAAATPQPAAPSTALRIRYIHLLLEFVPQEKVHISVIGIHNWGYGSENEVHLSFIGLLKAGFVTENEVHLSFIGLLKAGFVTENESFVVYRDWL